MSGFLIEVDTLRQSSGVSQSVQESEIYTEQIEVKGGKTAYRDYTGQVKRIFQGL